MTNAIEQTKREMYEHLDVLKYVYRNNPKPVLFGHFESALEEYLEALGNNAAAHYNSEELSHCRTKIERDDLQSRLAAMTEERDAIQLRLHAVDHAYKTQQDQIAIRMPDSGDRGASEQIDGKTVDVLACALTECQSIVTSWAMNGLRAKKAIRAVSAIVNGSPMVLQAMQDFEKADPGVCGYCDGLGYIHCNGGRPTAPCPNGCQ